MIVSELLFQRFIAAVKRKAKRQAKKAQWFDENFSVYCTWFVTVSNSCLKVTVVLKGRDRIDAEKTAFKLDEDISFYHKYGRLN